MTSLESLALKGTAAVKRLRSQTLAEGFPFMINDDNLPSGQCYLEQPDGYIHLVKLAANGRDFDLVQKLTAEEAAGIRAKHGLPD